MFRGNIFLLLFVSSIISEAQVINSSAGNGISGYTGDGGPSLLATMTNPRGIAIDNFGNLFIADHNNSCIRKVNASGIISTVAGCGVMGYSGDGGPANLAHLDRPNGVAVDALGNIYISDAYNHRIRKVDTSGIISTIAGTGINGFSGDGGPASAALIEWPFAIATDVVGNIYFGDSFNHRIRKINSAGIISTIAGTGIMGYSGDGGPATLAQIYLVTSIAIDAFGNIFLCDEQNHSIRKIDSLGIITTIAGSGVQGFSGDGGPATLAKLDFPQGVCISPTGDIYITDRNNFRIRKVSLGKIYTIAGNGSSGYSGDGGNPLSAQMGFSSGIALSSSGNIMFADESNLVVRVVCPAINCPQTDSLSNVNNVPYIFPNPSNDVITIKGIEKEELILTDNRGNLICHIALNEENNFKCIISNLENGIYFLTGKNINRKIVVLH